MQRGHAHDSGDGFHYDDHHDREYDVDDVHCDNDHGEHFSNDVDHHGGHDDVDDPAIHNDGRCPLHHGPAWS